jgi:DNA-binding SARP family transcriptional activator
LLLVSFQPSLEQFFVLNWMRDLRTRLLPARPPSADGSAATFGERDEQEIEDGVAAGQMERDGEGERSDWPAKAAGLSLYLFGPLRVSVDGQLVIGERCTRRKVKALLGYLYLRRNDYISKDELLEALWPEVDDATLASGRLKQSVLVLRRTLEGHTGARGAWRYVLERGGSYFFNAQSAYYSDVEDFEAALERAASDEHRGDVGAALVSSRHAVELYRADLLQDFRYEDWAAVPASLVRERYVQALEQTARLYGLTGESARAVQLLRRAVREEPLRESSSLQLMECLRRRGDHVEAVRVYLRLKALLERTLELEPGPEATALFEAMRRDRSATRTLPPGSRPAA